MSIIEFTVPPLPHYIIGGHADMPPGRKHPGRRAIGVFDLIVVIKGSLYLGEEDRHYEVRAGHVLILRPDAEHYPTRACEEDTEYYWAHFHTLGGWSVAEDTLAPARMSDSAEPVPVDEQFAPRLFVKRIPQFAKAVKLTVLENKLLQLSQMSINDHIHGVRWKQQLLFQEVIDLLSASVEAGSPTPALACAEKAASYLRHHYREDITAQSLGESINFHPVYIARCMKREFGCSPFDYLLRFRIQQAKLLLLQTDLSVSRIAEEVGFNQSAYFATCFARFEGLSPRQYRQRFSLN
ncbi:helix-turn-helix domain-containing protein [Paenibacillus sp. PAMC21692]|uniref:helix-turn-helix domain-containing protein n=1 Tax=Paenibacillus sp. PAMC21692 TaxID=2762320 RepID=UPI00164D59C7|nr:helix-turn-helix domain-containing protein [Paenibacillus sp. PAMC21692]QNK57136.1 helix-turn-helix domain-containing protein [Paenibacillus sp. PAMC21692]